MSLDRERLEFLVIVGLRDRWADKNMSGPEWERGAWETYHGMLCAELDVIEQAIQHDPVQECRCCDAIRAALDGDKEAEAQP